GDAVGETEPADVVVTARGEGATVLPRRPPLALHPLVLRPAAALSRGPARSQHVRGLAVYAVRRVDPQAAVRRFVYARRTNVGVEPRNLDWYVPARNQVARNGIASRVPRLEHRIDLADTTHRRRRRCDGALGLCIAVHRVLPAGKTPA